MTLHNLSPLQQLRAGRLPLRLLNLVAGLLLFALAMALLVRVGLGVDPWDVLHLGIVNHLPISLGTVVILVGILVLLAWIPLKQWPGLGTIANVLVIGPALDFFLWVIPDVQGLGLQILTLAGAIVINGLGGALYIGCHFGPGPRDGLMTGLQLRTGKSIRLIRTIIELCVLGLGWLLGGPIGVGTVAYTLLIGPATQFFFKYTIVTLPRENTRQSEILA